MTRGVRAPFHAAALQVLCALLPALRELVRPPEPEVGEGEDLGGDPLVALEVHPDILALDVDGTASVVELLMRHDVRSAWLLGFRVVGVA
jgi:hypothetical protein